MERYSESVIPLLPQTMPVREPEAVDEKLSISRKRLRSAAANGRSTQKGREKRKEMNASFDVLQSLVPNLAPKATRENIVTETIRFIDLLQKQLTRLEMQKKPSESVTMIPGTYSDSSGGIIASVSGNIVLFRILTSVRRGLVTQILMAFERHQSEVLAASVAVSHGQLTLTVTASVRSYVDDAVEKIKIDILSLKS